jgi:hypothetical protein
VKRGLSNFPHTICIEKSWCPDFQFQSGVGTFLMLYSNRGWGSVTLDIAWPLYFLLYSGLL